LDRLATPTQSSSSGLYNLLKKISRTLASTSNKIGALAPSNIYTDFGTG